MSSSARFLGEVASSTLAAALLASLWARTVSLIGTVSWMLVLLPVCVLCIFVVRRVAQKVSYSTRGRIIVQSCSFIAGALGIYLVALVVSWGRSDLVPDPLAVSNAVPGVIAGGIVWLVTWRGKRAPQSNSSLERAE